jgi:type I restriction enzyme S subunit
MKTGRAVLNTVQVKKNEWVETNLNHNEVKRVYRRLSKFSTELITPNNLPDNWCWAKLEDVSLFVVDCHNKTAPYERTGIALIRTSNIRDGNFIWDDLRYVSEATYKYWSKRCYPEAGDVVFTREAPLGEAAIIPLDRKICLGQRTMLIRTVEDHYLAKFLLISLMDPKFKSRSEEIAVGTGVKHFRVGDVSDLIVPVPPTEEQTEIVRRVEELFTYADRIEARYQAARRRVEKLTPAVLAKAFRGELVPQNPDDEPASVLLERIQASRAANAVTSKSRRVRNGAAK